MPLMLPPASHCIRISFTSATRILLRPIDHLRLRCGHGRGRPLRTGRWQIVVNNSLVNSGEQNRPHPGKLRRTATRAADEIRARHPRIVIVHTPKHASWLNQIEIYFSIIQRKVLTPNDCTSLQELEDRINEFGRRYSALGKPFAWCFTRQDLERRLLEP